MTGLTAKQIEVLTFIRGFIATHKFSPTVREIGEGVGCKSTSNVHRYLSALERRGHIERLHGHARSIAITRQARAA